MDDVIEIMASRIRDMPFHAREATAVAKIVLDALTEADFAIVPAEPTPEMIEAAIDEIVVGCCVMDPKSARDTYRAMLATGAAV